ncbi:MAG TPA: hypothetical protein VE359_20335 [Vicinamibacteria bacterium]|nr:hypothetical protein [Vicinamibacteria bacterium]
MSLDLAVFAFGVFITLLVAAGAFLAYYAPAYREEARRDGVSPTKGVLRLTNMLGGKGEKP